MHAIGRTRLTRVERLLVEEAFWRARFFGLRDGLAEVVSVPHRRSGTTIEGHTDTENELTIVIPGTKTRSGGRSAGEVAESQAWASAKNEEYEKFHRIISGEEKTRDSINVYPPEPHLWDALKRAGTPAQVRRICRLSRFWLTWDMKFPNGHIENPSLKIKVLYDDAEQLIEAKNYRYPESNRPTSDDKKIIHFSRAMAGRSLAKAISSASAIDLLRRVKHGRRCECPVCRVQEMLSTSSLLIRRIQPADGRTTP